AFLVDRLLGSLTATPPAFSPNGDGVNDTIALGFVLSKPALVTVEVRSGGEALATVSSGELQPGQQQVTWDGSVPGGRVPPGQYEAVVTAVDDLAQSSQALEFVVTPS